MPTPSRRPTGSADYGTYDLFVPDEHSTSAIESEIYDALREALVGARGCGAATWTGAQVEAMMRVTAAASVTVADGGERRTNVGFNRALPFVFAGLLVFGVMIGGQTLLTSDRRGEVEPRRSRSCCRRCRRSS